MSTIPTGTFIPAGSSESGVYCPVCRDTRGVSTVKMVREHHLFSCQFGHKLTYAELHSMNPDMVKIEVKERPDPALDAKVEAWVRKDIWQRFEMKYAGRVNATLNSVCATMLDGDFLFLTGEVVRALNKAGIRKQEDIMAMVEENQRLVAENEQVSRDSQRLASLFANAAKGLGGEA